MSPKPQGESSERDILGLDEPETGPPVTQDKQRHVPTIIVWKNVINYSLLHLAAVNGLFLLTSASWQTLLWSKFKSQLYSLTRKK